MLTGKPPIHHSVQKSQTWTNSKTTTNRNNCASNLEESRETIHSGHFMISNVPQEEDDAEERSVTVAEEQRSAQPADRSQANNLATNLMVNSYRIRSSSDPMLPANKLKLKNTRGRVIDSSLSKLFECMTLAYRQKLTSPKWNNFKGLKLRLKIKIRLNNIIWRAWHMQFVKQVRPLIAPFAVEVDPTPHAKAEAILLEGKYWKRRLEMVSAEYRRWRVWYKDRAKGRIPQETPLAGVNIDVGRLERQTDSANPVMQSLGWYQHQLEDEPMLSMDDMNFPPDLADVLFSRFSNQAYPSPVMSGNADFIQPGLMQLQPSWEELMDTLEPLHDFLHPGGSQQSAYSGYGANFGAHEGQYSGDMYASDNDSNQYWRQQQQQPIADKYSNQKRFDSHQQQQQQQQQFTQPQPPAPSYSQNYVNLPPPFVSYPQTEQDRRDSRQRSMSGPILGGSAPPLIEPTVLSALAAGGYGRSNSNEVVKHDGFAVPQATRGRKPKTVDANSQRVKKLSANLTPSVHQLETSTPSTILTQLLTTDPRSNKSLPSPRTLDSRDNHNNNNVHVINFLSSSPPMKKLAPKPVVTADNKISLGEIKARISTNAFVVPAGEITLEPPTAFQFSAPPKQHADSSLTYKAKCEDSPKLRTSESRRMNHISAEQKRRGHIKSGFEVLHGLVPSLAQSSAVKVSKAVVLHKGAEYIHQLKDERRTMNAEVEELKQQIEMINQAVIACQQQLPATGAPVHSRARNDRMNDMFEEYIRTRTMQNWKFWLFSHIMRPLFDGYATNVSTRSMDDMGQSVMSWLDQQCSLVQLRPIIKEAMRKLSTTTHVLSDPARLPDEARTAVQKTAMH